MRGESGRGTQTNHAEKSKGHCKDSLSLGLVSRIPLRTDSCNRVQETLPPRHHREDQMHASIEWACCQCKYHRTNATPAGKSEHMKDSATRAIAVLVGSGATNQISVVSWATFALGHSCRYHRCHHHHQCWCSKRLASFEPLPLLPPCPLLRLGLDWLEVTFYCYEFEMNWADW